MPNTASVKPGDRIRYATHSAFHKGTVIAVGGGYVVATSELTGRAHTQPYVVAVESVEVI
jgi:hypothetical protein